MTARTRVERDSLGPVTVDDARYWGAHTERARRNFAITGQTIASHPELVVALAQVKQAASRANRDLGLVEAVPADAVDRACQEIVDGRFHEEFVVDVLQGGAGTSSNMNANEVIANRAGELLGHRRGSYEAIHPIDTVNRGQSTNDVYPTAVRLATISAMTSLAAEVAALSGAFAERGMAFTGIIKVGRTQLQDAVPMTLGQEFTAFAITLGEEVQRLTDVMRLMTEVNLGGTAIGTGITAAVGFGPGAIMHLRSITGIALTPAPDLIEASSDAGDFLSVSGAMKRCAVKLSKICNDLRLLSSGPRTGLAEINLPPRQAGSSLMPGKVNPVIPEMVNQVAFAVIGADATVTFATEAGQLQLNAFEPVIAHYLLESARWLRAACRTLREECVTGISADEGRLADALHRSTATATALVPFIGYVAATEVAQLALSSGEGIPGIVLRRGLLDRQQIEDVLSPNQLTGAVLSR